MLSTSLHKSRIKAAVENLLDEYNVQAPSRARFFTVATPVEVWQVSSDKPSRLSYGFARSYDSNATPLRLPAGALIEISSAGTYATLNGEKTNVQLTKPAVVGRTSDSLSLALQYVQQGILRERR